MNALRFEDPPPKRGTRAIADDHKVIALELRSNPGRWAILRTVTSSANAHSEASRIRNGRTAAFRPGFEARGATVDGEHRVYVRYVGNGDRSAS